MVEHIEQPLYYLNPYGERIHFSLQGKHSVFRNNIVTPGATSFNKDEFRQDILSIFAANRVVSLGLVVLELNRLKLDPFLAQNTQKLVSTKEVMGFGLDEQRSAIAPFQFKGIRSDVRLEDLQSFLIKHSCFSIDKPIHSLQFIDKPDKKKGLGGDKYFSEFIITTILPTKQTYTSSFYTSAKHINLLSLVEDFQPFSLGKVVSITRQLSLNNSAFATNKDLSQIIPYGVTGIGQTQLPSGEQYSSKFSFGFVNIDKIHKELIAFAKKYMRIRANSIALGVTDVNISDILPIRKTLLADKMRFNPTLAEQAMGQILGSLGLDLHQRFKRQINIAGYIADFYSKQLRIVVEVDGNSHLTKKAKEVDKTKEIAFFRHQIITIRVSNHDAINNPEKVKAFIENAIKKWRKTPFIHNSWDLSDEEITSQIVSFRKSLGESFP